MARYIVLLSVIPAAAIAAWLLVSGSAAPARPLQPHGEPRSLPRVTEQVHANAHRPVGPDLPIVEDSPPEQPLVESAQTAPSPATGESSPGPAEGAVFIGKEVEPELANDDPTSQPETLDEHPAEVTKEEQDARNRERISLHQRWTGQEPSPEATEAMQRRMDRTLQKYNLDEESLRNVDCKKAICRFELVTTGTLAIDALTEVNRLGRAARELGDTWLATTEQGGVFHIEVFSATEGHALTGPDVQ